MAIKWVLCKQAPCQFSSSCYFTLNKKDLNQRSKVHENARYLTPGAPYPQSATLNIRFSLKWLFVKNWIRRVYTTDWRGLTGDMQRRLAQAAVTINPCGPQIFMQLLVPAHIRDVIHREQQGEPQP